MLSASGNRDRAAAFESQMEQSPASAAAALPPPGADLPPQSAGNTPPNPAQPLAPTVAIIGSGPSGLYAFKRLAAHPRPLSITVFESGSVPGIGSPYDPALNDNAMLANIASIELPAVTRSLVDWLAEQSAGRLADWGIGDWPIDERTFYPRVVLGGYYADEFARLVEQAQARGHAVTILTERFVADVHAQSAITTIKSVSRAGEIALDTFDFVIMASGHQPRAPAGHTWAQGDEPDNLYRELRSAEWSNRRLGVLGTSLSAIDTAIAAAAELGEFAERDGVLTYRADNPADRFHLTLMSRRGILPEIDFYCPIPYEPLTICTSEALAAAVSPDADGGLDRVFDVFRQQLQAQDPAYAAALGLDQLDADSFADAYFAPRRNASQIDWARANLAEIEAHHARQQTVAWKYALLRMHEPIGEVVAQFGEADRDRFARGLALVFIDNYAGIPPLSIKRLLALAEAGRLEVCALGQDYDQSLQPDGGVTITTAERQLQFDRVFDARGQSALGPEELPFPTLRMQIMANALRDNSDTANEIDVSGSLALLDGVNRVSNVYCLSIPHLMRLQPFVQGLTSCEALGTGIAQAVIKRAERPQKAPQREDLQALIAEVEQTDLIDCVTSGAVITVPRGPGADQ